MTKTFRLLCACALWLAAFAVSAHEMTMAEMQVRETAPGQFLWLWGATEKGSAADQLEPHWPTGCTADGSTLHCGDEGLKGVLSIDGVGQRFSAALVKIYWLDGQSRVYTLTGGQPRVQLYGGADDRRGWREIASAYVVLGVEHILGGVDHLLFVISLLFLVGFRRQLVWTITAFTAAHSLTLASAALTRRLEAGIVLIVGDDRVQRVEQFEPGRAKFDAIEFNGRGGTDFTPLIEEADRHHPDIGVVLTDLDGPARFRPRWPVIWAVPESHAHAQAPFGRKLTLS